jgi:heme/copper-type cytochrome/quinol oxidase subunit 2
VWTLASLHQQGDSHSTNDPSSANGHDVPRLAFFLVVVAVVVGLVVVLLFASMILNTQLKNDGSKYTTICTSIVSVLDL